MTFRVPIARENHGFSRLEKVQEAVSHTEQAVDKQPAACHG
jgi:hypothetical protein